MRTAALLFLLTGATALVAEQSFEKMLGLLLGTSTPAAAVVLAIYFAGLTLGGFAYRWIAKRAASPLKLYGVLEIGVGVWALLLSSGMERLIDLFLPLLRGAASHGFTTLQMARFLVAACWIIPPTFLMGLTFPAMVDVLGRIGAPRRAVSFIYSVNLLGALGGAILGPFLLFPTLGLDGALVTMGIIDLSVGLAAIIISKRQSATVPAITPQEEHTEETSRGPLLLFAASFLSGLLFFMLEVLWTHLMSVVIGNSVYAFATMLGIVLLALFIGGTIASTIFRNDDSVGLSTVATCVLASALLLGLQHILWPLVPNFFTRYGQTIDSFAAGELLRAMVAAAVILPAAIPLGMVFPLLFRLREFPLTGRGTTAGVMTALNAIGSVSGALLCAFAAIPLAGSEAALLLIALTYAVVAIATAIASEKGAMRLATLAVAGLAILASPLLPPWNPLKLTSGEHVYFRPGFVTPDAQLLFFHEDTAGGITTVVNTRGGRVLLTNGKFQGNDSGERAAQIGFALTPAIHVGRLDRALVIGLGTGHSAAVVHDLGFKEIDVAEIAPGIVDASRKHFGHVTGNVLSKPNVHLAVEDGRNFLLLHDQKYDLITMEISSIWFAGATNLYSRDYYAIAKKRLAPGGVLQQWIQLHHIGLAELMSVIATVREEFPHVSFWVFGGQGIIVASHQPQVLRQAGVSAAENLLRTQNQIPQGTITIDGLLASRLLAPPDVDRLVTSFETAINTDRSRYLEYATPRYNLSRIDYANLNVRFLQQFSSRAPFVRQDQ